jgi:dTDP-L-rhamnose 4-epimerase
MAKTILITGGSGFIGSHLADQLLARGHKVRALDNLTPQVHGDGKRRPDYLADDVELVVGDVRDRDAVRQALKGVDLVYHFAAAVGVGQSMYEIETYTSVNNLGTAVLTEALIERPVEKLVVASSMSIYGEGLYRGPGDQVVMGRERSEEQLKRGDWELKDDDGRLLSPLPTPETKIPSLASVYALGKYDQERMSLLIGKAYRIPTVAMRFFNVYGPRQALSNPYTGVMAIFASRLLNDKAPMIFEDGHQHRDFVSVHDVARACVLAMEKPVSDKVLNVGSGHAYSIIEVAERMARSLGKEHIHPEITGKYRVGDIRHCYADIGEARRTLGYEPRVRFEDGLDELVQWLDGKEARDGVQAAREELMERGLTI